MGPPVLLEMEGVLACILGNGSGELLAHAGRTKDAARAIANAAGICAGLARAGMLCGLGGHPQVTSRERSSTWIMASDGKLVVAVQTDGKSPTTTVEAALQSKDWTTLVEDDVLDADIEAEPHEPSGGAAAIQGEQPTRPRFERPLLPSASSMHPTAPPVAPPAVGAKSAPRIIATVPAFTGNLQLLSLADLLEFLRGAQRTGTLVCSSRSGVGRVHMRGGRIVGASSTSGRPLSEYVVKCGPLGPDKLAALRDIGRDAWLQPDIGGLLVSRAIATTAHVRAALGLKISDVLREMLQWRDGDFSFDSEGARAPRATAPELEYDAQELLLDIFADMDEVTNAKAR